LTDSIRFRELNMKDAEDLFDIYSDKEAMKYRGSKAMESVEDAKKYIANKYLIKEQIRTLRKGVELVRTKELIGSVMYRFDRHKKAECEIGYSIGRRFWGKGLGKEIVKVLFSLEKEKTIKAVIAWSNKENIASIRILEKMGFQLVEQDANQNANLYRRKVG